MRSCQENSALVSKALDKKLTLAERFSVWLHLMMCTRCRNFRTQTLFIRKVARQYTDALQSRTNKKP